MLRCQGNHLIVEKSTLFVLICIFRQIFRLISNISLIKSYLNLSYYTWYKMWINNNLFPTKYE